MHPAARNRPHPPREADTGLGTLSFTSHPMRNCLGNGIGLASGEPRWKHVRPFGNIAIPRPDDGTSVLPSRIISMVL